jgi:hypothetical protein
MVDLSTGSVEPLTDFSAQELWSYPRWSPDGRWIAAGRWSAGAYFDVVILDPRGDLVWEVTKDRAIDNAPSWSPDGRWLLWSSDRTGIPNLLAVPVDADSGEPGATRQITNLLGGGAYPAVDPGGRWIYFSSYHADGWRVERVPFEPGSWFLPFTLAPTFQAEVDLARFDRRASGEGRPYNSLQTLRPTYWAPTYREGDHTGTVEVLRPGYGIYTSGEDLVGRHSYSLSGTLSQGAGSFNGQASYSYGGLENPLFSLALSQTHDAGSRPLAGVTQTQDTVPLYLVERDRAVGLSAVFLRRRFRTQTTLGFAVSHVWEDNFLLERNLEESTRFRLRRPEVRLGEARATLSFGNARSFPFSISAEDGVGATIRARVRRDLTLVDSLKGAEGWDRSYQDLVGYFAAYKGLRGPGFGNHVLGFRGSGGVAGGPGADAFHFEVGGASGGDVPLEFIQIGQGLLFPVRGYTTATRFGRYAWSTSVEYRFPIKLINRGPGLFPLHFDWISGAVFFDAGNAWGPEISGHGGENPRRASLASTGAELLLRALPLWFQNIDLRFGLALPLVEERGPRSYLRLGLSF